MKKNDTLTSREEEVLGYLWDWNEPLTQNEMAERLADQGWNNVTLYKTVQSLSTKMSMEKKLEEQYLLNRYTMIWEQVRRRVALQALVELSMLQFNMMNCVYYTYFIEGCSEMDTSYFIVLNTSYFIF